MAPNSWRYLIVFLGECRGAGIIPSRTLFFACFLVCKSQGGYYLTARVGFKVSGAPTNNKGWKARYFFVSVLNWGFRADWSIHPISNVPPLLSEEESVAVNRLRGILPLSQAIQNMTERWLVEAWLSPASRGTMDLNMLRKKPRMLGGKGAPAVDHESAHSEVEVTHTEASGKRPAGGSAPDPTATDREREPKVSIGDASPTYRRPKSMRDRCDIRIREDNEGYYVLHMADWAPRDSSAAMRARWSNLSYQTQV
ncbi:hypothetical protein GW17_00061890 [Ensete ventricosum]|nr:hypothetical protein GW17_00061890 [Ensete ventricosum]